MKKVITLLSIALACLMIGGALFIFVPQLMGETPQAQEQINFEPKDTASFSPGESIITNIKGSQRYIKLSLTLEIINKKELEYFEKNEYKIRDIVIRVLRNKTEAELSSHNSQELLKADIKTALSEKLDTKKLLHIYINDFVIQ